jgi:hypothetical protein
VDILKDVNPQEALELITVYNSTLKCTKWNVAMYAIDEILCAYECCNE